MGLARDGRPSSDIDLLPEGDIILDSRLSPPPLTSPSIGLPVDATALDLTLGGLVALILSVNDLDEDDATVAPEDDEAATRISWTAGNTEVNSTVAGSEEIPGFCCLNNK